MNRLFASDQHPRREKKRADDEGSRFDEMVAIEKMRPDEGHKDSAWVGFLKLEKFIDERMQELRDTYADWSTKDASGKSIQLQGSSEGR